MYQDPCDCKKQHHVHELTGSTRIFNEGDECHNHRYCTVTGEAIYSKDKHKHQFQVATVRSQSRKVFINTKLLQSPLSLLRYFPLLPDDD